MVKLEQKRMPLSQSGEIRDQVYLLELDIDQGNNFECVISNALEEQVLISLENGSFSFDRSRSGITDFKEEFGARHEIDLNGISVDNIKVYVDKTSMEVFINDGERVMTEIIFPNKPLTRITTKGAVKNGQVILLQ